MITLGEAVIVMFVAVVILFALAVSIVVWMVKNSHVHEAPVRCPACGSHDPRLHPAVQLEGEVHVCKNPFHAAIDENSNG